MPCAWPCSEDIGWEELQRIIKPEKKSKGSGNNVPADGSKPSIEAAGASKAGTATADAGQMEGAAAGSRAGKDQKAGAAAGDKGSGAASAAKGKDSSAAGGEKGVAAAQKKRVVRFPQVDPKDRCGECKHCLNPQWHKACLVARCAAALIQPVIGQSSACQMEYEKHAEMRLCTSAGVSHVAESGCICGG